MAIVGLGLMGASLALALKEGRPDLHLIGIDRDSAVVAKALDRGAVAEAATTLGLATGADVIVLATPIRSLRRLLHELAPLAAGAVVTDLASTKVEVMAWAAEAGLDLVGGHPMCGREATGIDAADPRIYQGAAWVLTRSDPRVEQVAGWAGAVPLVIDAGLHDRLVAGISHAGFLVSVAYLLGLTRQPEWPRMGELAGPGFRDMTRLAQGDPQLYMGIVETNRQQILDVLAAVRQELDGLSRRLESGDPGLLQLLEEARAQRRRWESERSRAGSGPPAG